MIMQVFAIKDRALNAFLQPFFAPTIGAAIRAFSDGINDPQHAMNSHPDDYDLWHLATWDDASGTFNQVSDQHEFPHQVAIGKNQLREKK